MMNKKTFEKALDRLEEIANQLEDESVELEETLKLYKEAQDLAVHCQEKLDQAETELETLVKSDDGFELKKDVKGGL